MVRQSNSICGWAAGGQKSWVKRIGNGLIMETRGKRASAWNYWAGVIRNLLVLSNSIYYVIAFFVLRQILTSDS